MRILKLVIWDLDQTILNGILEEGDEELNPIAHQGLLTLTEGGVLQALATQNQPHLISAALTRFHWLNFFVQVEADLGPKVHKVRRIVETLSIHPVDAVFVDL